VIGDRNLVRPLSVVFWVVVALLMPTFIGSSTYRLGQLDYILSLVMVAVGLNITLGFAGQLFLGPSALFAVGGYTAAVVAFHSTVMQTLPLMCLAAIATTVIVAAAAALPSLRMAGFYLGMVTLFLALVIPDIASHWNLTGGSNGLSLVTLNSFVQHPTGRALYNVGVAIIVAACGYAWLIKSSRLGRRFGAIMTSEEMAQSVGISPYRTKLIAFLLGSIPCAIGGAFYVYSEQFINASAVQPQLSIYILAGLTIGGGGTIIGPVIGTALVGAATQFLGRFDKYQGIVYGLALIIVASSAPTGIVGLYHDLVARFRRPARPAAAPAAAAVGARDGERPEVVSQPLRDRLRIDESPPLVLKGVRRSFGGVRAVAGVDLVVEPGKVHALVGPNGSGKTTVLNLISGFYRIGGGEIWFGENRLDVLHAAQIAQLGIARTFQTPKLMGIETAAGNVVVGVDRTAEGSLTGAVMHTRRARRVERQTKAEAFELLDDIGLGASARQPAGLMPHGTQRLLEIGRAVAVKPRYVLLDEPAAGLAGTEVEDLKFAVREIAAAGVGVLFVEHNLRVVFGVADTVTVLHQGLVIASGTPAEVSNNPEVIQVYIGRQRTGAEGPEPAPPAPPSKTLEGTL
jgi:ABC-type branched-subunit amino acid transport system ATPase component/ABC-type branched-subunit amino acid transport system permease subunit